MIIKLVKFINTEQMIKFINNRKLMKKLSIDVNKLFGKITKTFDYENCIIY